MKQVASYLLPADFLLGFFLDPATCFMLGFLLGFFDPEDGSDMSLRNVG
jgi:hypothetical protein